jgi:hypothetical protein
MSREMSHEVGHLLIAAHPETDRCAAEGDRPLGAQQGQGRLRAAVTGSALLERVWPTVLPLAGDKAHEPLLRRHRA